MFKLSTKLFSNTVIIIPIDSKTNMFAEVTYRTLKKYILYTVLIKRIKLFLFNDISENKDMIFKIE